RAPAEHDLERLAVVTAAVAHVALHEDVRKEVHLDLHQSVALAMLATPALHVEREPPRAVAAHLGLRELGEQVADESERAGVGRRVRAWRAADRALVDVHHLVEVLDTLDRL